MNQALLISPSTVRRVPVPNPVRSRKRPMEHTREGHVLVAERMRGLAGLTGNAAGNLTRSCRPDTHRAATNRAENTPAYVCGAGLIQRGSVWPTIQGARIKRRRECVAQARPLKKPMGGVSG